MPQDIKENAPNAKKPVEEIKPEIIAPPEAEKPPAAVPPPEFEIEAPAEEEALKPSTPPILPQKPLPPPVKDNVLSQLEHILEEDLAEIYFNLPPEKQKKFHDKGDEIAGKIHKMIIDLKVKAKKVLNLVRGWLKIIPGINKFFLEQEAKIKTDKIMLLSEYEKEKRK